MSSPLVISEGPKARSRAQLSDTFTSASLTLQPLRDGQFYIGKEGAVYRHHAHSSDTLILAPEHAPVLGNKATTRADRDKLMRLKLLIQIRDVVRSILRKQEMTADDNISAMAEPPWAQDQRQLRTLYDNFVNSYGPINRTEVQQTGDQDENGSQISFIKQPNLRKFRKDPDAMLVASIELYDEATDTAKPGPIFSERVLAAAGKNPVITSPQMALGHVLNDKGHFDLHAVSALLPGLSSDDIIKELARQELIILDPSTREWRTAEDYLSGDVRAKLNLALVAAETHPEFIPTVRALQQVKPSDLSLAQIDYTLGAPWLPSDLIEAFGREVLGFYTIQVSYLSKTHKWFVDGQTSGDKDSLYTTEAVSMAKMLQSTLNHKVPSLPQRSPKALIDETEDKERRRQQKAELVHKQKGIEEAFHAWIAASQKHTALLEIIYNERFNSEVVPAYDGSHMTLPGASIAIHPYPHQLNIAWRNIMRGNTLNAHCLGSGKTIASIIACKEMRRLGLIKKPAFIVPNNLLAQVSRDFMSMYPNAHILVLEPDSLDGDGPKGSTRERMERFVEKARGGDWDAIFMTQANFDRLEVSAPHRLQILIDDVRDFQSYAAHPSYLAHSRIKNHLAKIIKKKTEKIESLILTEIKRLSLPDHFDLERALSYNINNDIWQPVIGLFPPSALPNFEEFGIDYLFIDEGQSYKNLEVISSNRSLAIQGSARAANLRFKLTCLEEHHPGCNLTIMTGTPISNSPAEIYTFQRYMDKAKLYDKGISNFDAWRDVFAQDVTSVEMDPEGSDFRTVTRLVYKNAPELMRLFRGFTDILDDTDLDLNRPRILGEEPYTYATEPSPRQIAIMGWLAARALQIRDGRVANTQDNILNILVDGRLAALHPRLVWSRYVQDIEAGHYDGPIDVPEAPGKLEAMTSQVAAIYHANAGRIYYDIKGDPEPLPGALQMIMCDLGVPRSKTDGALYHDMRRQLVNLGVPFEKIHFIHDYSTDRKKAMLFEQCQRGQVAVIIGTTQGLGTGSNIHRRLIALHELDCPWTPSEVRQRRGRIDRPGNKNADIYLMRYVTRGSHDVYSWQTILHKARFINQIMRGNSVLRHATELDDEQKEFSAILDIAIKGFLGHKGHHPPPPRRNNSSRSPLTRRCVLD